MSNPCPVSIFRHKSLVSLLDREKILGHASLALWLTGLSGAGKSTIAHSVEKRLIESRIASYVLDGDNVRHGLCSDLGFSSKDRSENVRRIAEVTKLFLDAGLVVLTAFISPYAEDRYCARQIIGPDRFFEIYCKCPLAVCEQRDVKGLYAKARKGLIEKYTGVTDPYQEPELPDMVLETNHSSIVDCTDRILHFIKARAASISFSQSS